jgi:hypothetical protein
MFQFNSKDTPYQKTETFLLVIKQNQQVSINALGGGFTIDYTVKYEGADSVLVNGYELTEGKGAITFGGYPWAYKQDNLQR